jgi:hypothetical protein
MGEKLIPLTLLQEPQERQRSGAQPAWIRCNRHCVIRYARSKACAPSHCLAASLDVKQSICCKDFALAKYSAANTLINR